MNNKHLTVALSLLVHGEAVRLNRGKSQDDYDFKYMRGDRNRIYPYVSSQCFKKYWREMLPEPFSPITRGKNTAGTEKNQAFTDGNPIEYLDDDLFGYMIAGANEEDEQDTSLEANPDQVDDALSNLMFATQDIADSKALLKIFKDGKDGFINSLAGTFKDQLDQAVRSEPSSELVETIIEALNQAIREPDASGYKFSGAQEREVKSGKKTSSEVIREALNKTLAKALPDLKRPTTKRTAPIRMHALVAFSGIKTARDFQTFSRDIAYTGKNSILNPNTVGIYSGWLKTRILIEGHRIGKFYIGPNRDILDRQAEGQSLLSELDPYTKPAKQVPYVQLAITQRQERLQQALVALANLGNRQGPASGALHDGSLKPKGFVGAFMQCADSPFDAIWQGSEDLPTFSFRRFKAILQDWDDLFAIRKIYIGLPVELDEEPDAFSADLMEYCKGLEFEFVVKTPRQALLAMAEDAVLKE